MYHYVVASSIHTREKASFSLFPTYVVENKPAFSPLKKDVRIGAFSRIMVVSLSHTGRSRVEALAPHPLVSMQEEGL